MDANFRLQSRLCASSLKHPALSPGWAYFVDNSPYAGFIKDYVDDEEVSQVSDVMSAPTHFQTDQILCRFSSTPQHAYQEVQGSPSNRPCCCQLRSSSNVPSVGSRGFTERRKVYFMHVAAYVRLLTRFTDSVTWTIFSHRALLVLVSTSLPFCTTYVASGSSTSGNGWRNYPLLSTSTSLSQTFKGKCPNFTCRATKSSVMARFHWHLLKVWDV